MKRKNTVFYFIFTFNSITFSYDLIFTILHITNQNGVLVEPTYLHSVPRSRPGLCASKEARERTVS